MNPFEVLRMRQGVQAAQVNIFDLTASTSTISPANAQATLSLNSSGLGSASNNSNWTWLLLGVNSDYQIKVHLNSGTTPSGDSLDSWLSLGSNRTWYIIRAGVGEITSVLDVRIRRVVDLVEIDTAIITLDATVDT